MCLKEVLCQKSLLLLIAAYCLGADDGLRLELAKRSETEGLTIGSAGNFTLELITLGRGYPITKRRLPLELMIARIGSSATEIVGLLMDGSLVKTDLNGEIKAELRSFSHIRSLALAKDGASVAFCGAYGVTGSAHGHVPGAGDRMYGIAVVHFPSNVTFTIRSFTGASELARCGDISWSSSGKELVYGYDGRLYIYDCVRRQAKYLIDGSLPAWHPLEQRIAFRAPDGSVQLTDLAGKQIRRLVGGNVVGGLRWSPDGQYLAFGEISKATSYLNSRLRVLRLADSAIVTVRQSIYPEVGRDEGWLFINGGGSR